MSYKALRILYKFLSISTTKSLPSANFPRPSVHRPRRLREHKSETPEWEARRQCCVGWALQPPRSPKSQQACWVINFKCDGTLQNLLKNDYRSKARTLIENGSTRTRLDTVYSQRQCAAAPRHLVAPCDPKEPETADRR